MAYTGSTIATVTAGQTAGVSTAIAAVIAAMNEFLAPWDTYTPTWAGSSSSPAIGNGSISGAYVQIGKMVWFRITIVAGSTTTFGSGNYTFTLPATAASATGGQVVGHFVGSRGGSRHTATLYCTTTSAVAAIRGDAVPGSLIGSSTVAWASGDTLTLSGFYEAA